MVETLTPEPRPRLAGAGAGAFVLAVALGSVALGMVIGVPGQGIVDSVVSRVNAGVQAVGFTILTLTGAVLMHRRPGHALGWLLAGAGIAQLLTMSTVGYVTLAANSGFALPAVALWATNWMWVPAQVGILLVLLRFPDGRLPGRGWRFVEYAALGWGAVTLLTTAFLPGPVGLTTREVDNPFGLAAAGPLLHALLSPLFLLLPLLTVAAALAPLLRWRRAGVHDRQQLRWIAAAAALTVVAAPLVLLGTDTADSLLALASLLFPAAIAVAVLRRRLWELGVIARAMLSLGVTGGLLVGAYVAAVRWLAGDVVPIVAGLVVAAAAIPTHRLIRRLFDRFLLGTNGDPLTVAADLRATLTAGPLDTLGDVSARLAHALRLPWVGFEDEDGGVVAEAGERGTAAVLGVPVLTGGRRVGRLLAQERTAGEAFSPRDVTVLSEVADAAALVVRAVHADERLAESRQRLGTVRREERARLQRDLHDGLGPVLGGITLRAEAAHNLVSSGADPDRVVEQLESIGTDAEGAVAEIRRLIDELRPTALGEAGLAEAVEVAVASLADGLVRRVALDLPDALGSRTEVAAYRIVVEAVRNVVRHAEAHTVTVEGRVEREELVLSVGDDGRGLGEAPPGVGIRAMTDRATELGGSLTVRDHEAGGTEVIARLPLGRGEA